MNPNRDCTSYAFWITLWVVVGLIGVSQLPAFDLAGTFIKRVNILSDVLPREDSIPEKENAESVFDTMLLAQIEAEALSQMDSTARLSETSSGTNAPQEQTQHWNLSDVGNPERTPRHPVETILEPGQPLIEDYGGDVPAMEAFYRVWDDTERTRPLRIAVLGDSFIEGDILTADLREQLQEICGGSGVGFVPFATAMAKFRASVLHQYSGWEISTLQDRSSLPEEMRNKFFVSGSFAVPEEGATTRLEGTRFKQFLETCGRARLLFINRGTTRLDVLINDSVSRRFEPPSGEWVQQIVINAPIHSIGVTLTQTEGFIGYGIILEDAHGVSVDNFSIRGNSGLALYGTDRSINNQMAQLAGYDLVILQYGLNVMSAEVTRYDYYGKKLVNVIRYIQQCFPGSSILVMGVGDRSTQRDGQFVTMPGVYGLIEAQRTAAQDAGVAFWDTFEAMGGPGSMATYVKNKWAAQDYTHIRHPGGRRIATKLVASLVHGRERTAEAVAERERRAEELRLKALLYQTHLQEAMESDSLSGIEPDSFLRSRISLSDSLIVRDIDSLLNERDNRLNRPHTPIETDSSAIPGTEIRSDVSRDPMASPASEPKASVPDTSTSGQKGSGGEIGHAEQQGGTIPQAVAPETRSEASESVETEISNRTASTSGVAEPFPSVNTEETEELSRPSSSVPGEGF